MQARREEAEIGVEEFEMVGGGGRVRRDAVHVDGQGADLLPSSRGVGSRTEARGRVEILCGAWMYGQKRKRCERG